MHAIPQPILAAERMYVLAHAFPSVASAPLDRQAKEIITASTRRATAPEMRDAHDPPVPRPRHGTGLSGRQDA